MSASNESGVGRRTFLGSGIALIAATAGAQPEPTPYASDPAALPWPAKERFPLWPGKPPGAPRKPIAPDWTMNGPPDNREIWVRGVAMPEVHVFRPARPDGSSLLSIPGGGYGFLSVQNEGIDVAERFNAEGTTVFVLTYRLPGEGWTDRAIAPLQDAQRAMRLIRSRAADFRIDPGRLGILGFSAGGHLASDLAVSHGERTYAPVDAADSLPATPAFAGLIYPVTTLAVGLTHGGSRDSLLGPNPSPQQIAARSPLQHVGASTPPCFLLHAFDDDTVPVGNSLAWISACEKAKVSVEAHLLAQGGHGFGLHLPPSNSGSLWPDLFAIWVREHGG